MSSYSHTDAARPNRLKTATIDGKSHTFGYDADGNITGYDCTSAGCGDDKFIDWNGRNLPARITLGASGTTAEPTARDEFAYGPDGARYHRKTTHMDGRTLRTEHTYYVGAFEELLPRAGAAHTSIRQTRVTDGVRHVKTTAAATDDEGEETTTTASYVDYMHRDHLGSVEGTTDASGARTRTFAHDPFGERRKADWTAALTESERVALESGADPRTRGHTGHEHLERTGFIHRGGRVYDPTLGRFLSPDPLVSDPASAQAWNGYSYVSNSPMSLVDPSGLSQRQASGGCVMAGFMCRQGGAAGGGFGLASVVSTHRFHWVDVFFSFVSSWFNPGWGGLASTPPFNPNAPHYFRGGGFGHGGWDSYDSFGSFHFGIAFFSVAFQVTSHVAVAGTPEVSRKDIRTDDTTKERASKAKRCTGGQMCRGPKAYKAMVSRMSRILENGGRAPIRHRITRQEAKWWWQNAAGMDLIVDGRVLSTTRIGDSVIASDVLVHGQVVTNPANGRIYDGHYDFEPLVMENRDNSALIGLRNLVNRHLREQHGPGTPFLIKYRYEDTHFE